MPARSGGQVEDDQGEGGHGVLAVVVDEHHADAEHIQLLWRGDDHLGPAGVARTLTQL